MDQKKPYERPRIIYADVLKTRAGSPLSEPQDPANPFDPVELFGKD